MICLICREAETVDGFTPVTFARGEFRLKINEVPARVCPGCREAYLIEATAEKLLRFAGQCAEDGNLETECEFSTLPV